MKEFIKNGISVKQVNMRKLTVTVGLKWWVLWLAALTVIHESDSPAYKKFLYLLKTPLVVQRMKLKIKGENGGIVA